VFFMHLPPRSHLVSAVEAIARMERKPFYAPIVRQGNFVLFGLCAPPTSWTAPYRKCFRRIIEALRARPEAATRSVQWPVTKPGRHPFTLERSGPRSHSSRTFYFKFARPVQFSATLDVEGSQKMMLFFRGERRGERHTRRKGGAGAPLALSLEIGAHDLRKIGTRHWRLDVSNNDPNADAACTLEIRY
jgi:hypothetical protein